jgi:uncharacterized protein (TIRG00374 family)
VLQKRIGLTMKKLLLMMVGVGVTAGSFYWSMKGVKLEDFVDSLKTANYLTLPFILLLLFVFYWLKAIRWSWMLKPIQELSTKQLFPPVMVGFAANNLLPAHLGEFVRVFLVGRRHKLPFSTVLSTVVLERVFDVMAILGLFAVSLQFVDNLPPKYNQYAIIIAGLSGIFVLCAAAFLIWTNACIRLFAGTLEFVRFVPEGIQEKLVSMVQSAGEGLNALRSFRTIIAIALNSLAQWILNGLIAWLALRAFHIPVAPTDGLIITAILAIAVMIPSTPGYFGLIQGAFKISILALGLEIAESRVFAASMYYHMSMYIPVTLSGLYFLNREGLSLRDLRRVSEADEQPTGQDAAS